MMRSEPDLVSSQCGIYGVFSKKKLYCGMKVCFLSQRQTQGDNTCGKRPEYKTHGYYRSKNKCRF